MSKIDDQIAKTKKEMEQRRIRLRELQTRATRQERKDDARRKLLYGAAYLTALESLTTDARQRSLTRVEARITRAKDRTFLGLEPLNCGDEEEARETAAPGPETPELPFDAS